MNRRTAKDDGQGRGGGRVTATTTNAFDCGSNIERLDGFVSGELDRGDSIETESHLASCAICASFVEDRRRVRTALRSTLSADALPPDDLLRETLSGLRLTALEERRRPNWMPLAAAAGLVIAATLAIAVVWTSSGYRAVAPAGRAAIRFAADADHHGKCVQEMAGQIPPAGGPGAITDPAVAVVESIVRTQVNEGTAIADAHRCTDGARSYVHVVLEREGALAGVLLSEADGVGEYGGGKAIEGTAEASTFTTASWVVSVFSDSRDIDASELAARLKPRVAEQLAGRFSIAVRVRFV